MKVVPQSVKLLSMTNDPIVLLERCGRVCYKSEESMKCENTDCDDAHTVNNLVDDVMQIKTRRCTDCIVRAENFIQGIVRRGHESVLEHASATFLLVTDRGLTHEIVRHRLCSYSQESTRYCNYGNADGGISVVMPIEFTRNAQSKADSLAVDDWYDAMISAEATYMRLIKIGVQPQWARSVLPTCLKAEIVMSANFRQWRHILSLRFLSSTGKAHPQIVALFKMVLERFMKSDAAPIFKDIWEASQ